MTQENQNEIMQVIDKILELVPTNKTKCFINQYVSDYIY